MSRRCRNPEAEPAGHWVTLKNKRRVKLDDKGRVVMGLPLQFIGIHVEDIARLSGKIRELEEGAEDCAETVRGGRRAKTFRTVEEGVKALLTVNPPLVDFLADECGLHCEAYRRWLKRGRRGPKPLPTFGDGRFDSIEVPLELEGKRAISSWLEAVYVIVPPSRRWRDFKSRLQYLADATGLSLQVPTATDEEITDDEEAGDCHQEADHRIGELIELARAYRLTGDDENEDVPF